MKIERVVNNRGEFWMFTFKNRKVSRKGTTKILEQLEGVEITHHPHWADDDVFCTFKFRDHDFEVYEMWGDSDEYTVDANEPNIPQLEVLAKHFEASAPIKGGDFAHNLYFFINWTIFSSVVMGVIFGVWSGIKWITS
ncbi:hypothetical protein A3766_19040 [Oleiphilus sp. HI0132]|uniref:hypothetical protein n=2 Tax=Oleiphilus sp. HI0132 TaxID=1822270 RepID=UPI0007C28679|nr:hypothetical protein [Oleiphilus sp. HI0132]KZZ74086.1 hypothetical protein A3766_19040 [Oleiphilus sp. HI0132]